MKKRVLFLMVIGTMTTKCSSDFSHFRQIITIQDFLSFENAFKRPIFSLMNLVLMNEKFIVQQADLLVMMRKFYELPNPRLLYPHLFLRRSKFIKNAETIMSSGEVCDFKAMTEDPEWYKVDNLDQLKKLQLDGTEVIQFFLKNKQQDY